MKINMHYHTYVVDINDDSLINYFSDNTENIYKYICDYNTEITYDAFLSTLLNDGIIFNELHINWLIIVSKDFRPYIRELIPIILAYRIQKNRKDVIEKLLLNA